MRSDPEIAALKKKLATLENEILSLDTKGMQLIKRAISLENSLKTALVKKVSLEETNIIRARNLSEKKEKALNARIEALKRKKEGFEKKKEMLKHVATKTNVLRKELRAVEDKIKKETKEMYAIKEKAIMEKKALKAKPAKKSKPVKKKPVKAPAKKKPVAKKPVKKSPLLKKPVPKTVAPVKKTGRKPGLIPYPLPASMKVARPSPKPKSLLKAPLPKKALLPKTVPKPFKPEPLFKEKPKSDSFETSPLFKEKKESLSKPFEAKPFPKPAKKLGLLDEPESLLKAKPVEKKKVPGSWAEKPLAKEKPLLGTKPLFGKKPGLFKAKEKPLKENPFGLEPKPAFPAKKKPEMPAFLAKKPAEIKPAIPKDLIPKAEKPVFPAKVASKPLPKPVFPVKPAPKPVNKLMSKLDLPAKLAPKPVEKKPASPLASFEDKFKQFNGDKYSILYPDWPDSISKPENAVLAKQKHPYSFALIVSPSNGRTIVEFVLGEVSGLETAGAIIKEKKENASVGRTFLVYSDSKQGKEMTNKVMFILHGNKIFKIMFSAPRSEFGKINDVFWKTVKSANFV